MKRLAFKIWILILITSGSLFAQKKTVYSEVFSADTNTTVILNFENTTVAIDESTDGKIHMNYTIEFNNYSKKDVQRFIDDINVEANMYDNTLMLKATSLANVSEIAYELEAPLGLTFADDVFSVFSETTNDTIHRKSKDSLISEISGQKVKQAIFKSLKLLSKNGEKKDIDFKKVKMYKSKFVIKLPAYVKVKIIGKQAQISLLKDMTNEISLNLKQGSFQGQYLSNTYNRFMVKQADFKVKGLSGGNYTFDNITGGIIGSVQNAEITSEFAKIEIGEIQDQVTITDFNGEYWFYNWSKNFNRFDLFSEYSKIHFFYPEHYDFSLKVVGNNTVNQFENIAVTMQPTKTDQKFNMMERKAQGVGHFSGAINFDLVRGILFTHNDTFTKPKP
ncbi:hypothetical protein [Psychroserpens sp. SPM9]|uniref:hypothetical protein n=1 Tax=Psychroserpens sp. SPM9 TaxID=2975598 RepID=UPI0021A58067|nr:hypothetical protein [Psychroserpens sp. SPM9]MDG5492074.1 hypothetical protein [Psychroserpens sp. SPM9]